MVDRSVVIVRPKRPYVQWANGCSPDDRVFSAEYFSGRSMAVLLPRYDLVTAKEAKKYIDTIWNAIFQAQLSSWNSDEQNWPKSINKKLFNQWFETEIIYPVIDSI